MRGNDPRPLSSQPLAGIRWPIGFLTTLMPEFSDFKTDPLAKAFQKRASKLVRRLAKPRLSDKHLYKIQESLIKELTSVENGITFYREEMRKARRNSAQLAVEANATKGQLTSVDKEAIK